jgi:hypothetical protein
LQRVIARDDPNEDVERMVLLDLADCRAKVADAIGQERPGSFGQIDREETGSTRLACTAVAHAAS